MRVAALVCAAMLGHAQQSVLTWHNENARTGQNLSETTLTPANVNSTSFGKLFVIPADGKVDAQPLYDPALTFPGSGSHNALYMVTEHDSAYALDADSGSVLWQVSLLGAGETTSDNLGCGQVTPEIGITSTPVIDPQSGGQGTMYAVAMTKDASGNYHQRIHALNLLTGAEEFGGPVEIRATYTGSGDEGSASTQTFDEKQHVERAGLTLLNGVVYTMWSSHCDDTPYTSWVIGYNEATLQQSAVIDLTANGEEGGLWQAGAGAAVDAAGNLYVLVGNGTFDTALNANGFPAKGDYGNGFVKISTAGGALAVADYFTMSNTVAESNADQDLGSGGPMVLPQLNNAQGNPVTLAVGAGKDGHIYVVNTNNMGKFNSTGNEIYQEMTSVLAAVYSSPAWFNGNLYYGSEGSALKMLPFTGGQFASPSSNSATTFEFPGTTPSISANGSSNGIVWAAENSSPAVLHAYNAGNLATELYNSNQASNGRDQFGDGNVFIVPTVANGKVYVGTTAGVGVFGLLAAPVAMTITSVSSAAGSAAGIIAPGEIVTIKGTGLGPAAGVSFSLFDPATGSVQTNLAGTQVEIGNIAAPILYTSATQINAIVPYAIAGQQQVNVQVAYQQPGSVAIATTGETLAVASVQPAIFTASMTGAGQAAAVNQDGTVNGPTNPAQPGSYVSVYFTGGGETNPAGVTGSVNGDTLKYLVQQPAAMVGGVAAQVTFAGSAPGYVDGLDQLNILLAGDTPAGAQQIVISADGVSSAAGVTIYIQ